MVNNNWIDFLINYALPAVAVILTMLSGKYIPRAAESSGQKRLAAANGSPDTGNGQSHVDLIYRQIDKRVDEVVARQNAQSTDVDNLEHRFEGHISRTQQVLDNMKTEITKAFTERLEDFKTDMRRAWDGQHNINKLRYQTESELKTSIQLLNNRVEALEAGKLHE